MTAAYIFRHIPSRAERAASSAASSSAGASGVARAPPLLRMISERFWPSIVQRARSAAGRLTQTTSRRRMKRDCAFDWILSVTALRRCFSS